MSNSDGYRQTSVPHAAYAAGSYAPTASKQGFAVRYWRGEVRPFGTALTSIFVGLIFPIVPAAVGRYAADNIAAGNPETLDYVLGFGVAPLLCLVFIWAGVGLCRCSWRVLRRPWTMWNGGSKGSAMFGVMMSLGLIGSGVILPIVMVSDMLTPPAVQHKSPPRIRR